MIKFVYFDVGGVVIRDFSATNKWTELRRSIGIKPEQDDGFDEFFGKYESEVCVGKDIESLVPILATKFGLSFPNNYSFLNDFVDRFEVNQPIWPALKKIKVKYRVGLLTNQYPGMLDAIIKRGLMPSVDWDVVIDSSVEHVRKPQKEMFDLAKNKAGVSGSEILFVENGKKHVEAAKQFGWQTFLYDSSDTEKASGDLLKVLGLS